MKKITVRQLTTAAMAGAAYAVLAMFGSVFGITYGPVQCRFSEALCVLPFLFPETAWGLGVGCLIANILSPYGLLDIIVGSLTTLIAAESTGATAGLGMRIRSLNNSFEPAPMLLYIIIIGILGITIEKLIKTAERRLTSWQEKREI